MRYPILTLEVTSELANHFLELEEELERSSFELAEDRSRWIGTGREVNFRPLDRQIPKMRELHTEFLETPESKSDADRFEGRIAGPIHSAITDCDIPQEALDDPGFWRYLALTRFWWFVTWRERGAFDSRESSKYIRYVNAKNSTVTVLLRTFNRGRLSLVGDSYYLAYAAPMATDLWQSHILPVNTSYSPEITRAFVSRHAQDRLMTDTLRSVAKSLNRTNTNIVTIDYNQEEAADYIDSHWQPPPGASTYERS